MKPLHSYGVLQKGLLAGAVYFCAFAYGQSQDSLTLQDIEMVRITKLNPKTKHQEKLYTSTSDFLNHDAGEFLSSRPEFSGIRKSGNYATDPVLRGFKYEQLNIVIDGMGHAINACPSRMDPAVSQINMNMIEQAEIYKGPYHFRTGPSLGGTINFKTVPAEYRDTRRLSGRYSAAFESNGSITRNEAAASLSGKKIVWDIFGSHQKGDSYKDGNGATVRSKFLRYSVGSKLNAQWNEVHSSALQVSNNQGRDVEFAALNMDLIYDKTWMLQGSHAMEWNGRRLERLDFSSFLSYVDHSMGTPNGMMVSDVASKTYGARSEAKFRLGKGLLYAGLDYKKEGAENLRMISPPTMKPRDGSAWQDSSNENLGFFAELQQNYHASRLSLSYRMDYNTGRTLAPSQLFRQLYRELSPQDLNHSLSAGYSQSLGRNTVLSLWAGRAQRSASLTERYINLFTVGNDSYEMLGNPELRPETNNQSDLIFTYKTQDVYFQANAFYSYLEDYISGVKRSDIKKYSMTSPGVRQYQNIEKAFKTGMDLSAGYKITPAVGVDVGIAYTYARDFDSGEPLPEIAPLDGRVKLHGAWEKFSAAVKYRYSAKQERISKEFGELPTEAFHVVDLEARIPVFSGASFQLGVYNLFDAAYSEHLSRTLSQDRTKRILSPGRSLSVGFTVAF
ncbi:TonB-dependent receptor domain-containing protein [Planobacterium oryzisoli]|uniref:TonB-dependent receptor n=1 Tax=Planobacterium oryzisoli TaxID=2771435 RepID=A0A930YWY8_9FLAO|nr:TonB-dependent receptor [Planobacterium oryzisoli]MBF5027957.1 TonB-dependent receptor [Planobacterium oryzisoli]